jgi:hypothetical protein
VCIVVETPPGNTKTQHYTSFKTTDKAHFGVPKYTEVFVYYYATPTFNTSYNIGKLISLLLMSNT